MAQEYENAGPPGIDPWRMASEGPSTRVAERSADVSQLDHNQHAFPESSPVNCTFGSVNVPVGVPGPITHDVLPLPSVPICWTLSGCSSAPGM